MIGYKMSLVIFVSLIIFGGNLIYYHPTSQGVNAQHHSAPPPAAAIGERKLVLDMQTIPVNITQGDDVMMTVGFLDEKKNANIQHVTFRMDISTDGKHILSDFFHDHSGEVKLMFKDKGGSSSRHTVGANQDVLTNAWIADPGSPITISGPVFNQSGTYSVDLELTTIDNDKTDLVEPLHYPVDIDVS
jgi:hypothetical protein